MQIIVLGGGISASGELPDHVYPRLQKAAELFQVSQTPIILSGKYSYLYSAEHPPRTEAQAMQEELVRLGIPESGIQREEQSQDTISNAYFLKRLLADSPDKHLVVITSDFHVARTEYIFRKVFGPEYQLEFVGTPMEVAGEKRKLVEARQQELLKKTQRLFEGMQDGDHEFLKGKFFTDPYYTEERPAWVREFVAKGK